MNKKLAATLFGTALSACTLSSAVQASLIDVGGGLIYDDVLDITWLQNANLADTRSFGVAGIDASGAMNWDTAQAWITAMNASNYLGHSDWRLPTVTPLNGTSFVYEPIHDGSHDRGYNIGETGTLYAASTAHEMAHLFYTTLGWDAKCAPSTATTDAGCLDRSEPDYVADWGPQIDPETPFIFTGLMSDRYWYGQENTIDSLRAFDFNFNDGQTGTGGKTGMMYAWAVLDGQATVVPVPAAVWLFGSGLLGLAAAGRRRRAV